MVQEVVLILGSITGLLAVVLGFVTARQRGRVDLLQQEVTAQGEDAKRCRIEMAALKQAFSEDRSRMEQSIRDLLIQLAVKK